MAEVSMSFAEACEKMSKEDSRTIEAILKRAGEVMPLGGEKGERAMDLTYVHAVSGLDLDGMLAGRIEDIAHDVRGIATHLDRETGQLRDCFVPRYARREEG